MLEEQPHVLVVDDDASFRRYAARSLRVGGYRCTVSTGVRDALECVNGDPYDLMVIDLRMGDGTALDLLRSLPDKHRLTPAIIVTAVPDMETAIDALRLSVQDYLIKPADDLSIRAGQAIRRAQARRTLQRSADVLAEWSEWLSSASDKVDALTQSLTSPGVTVPSSAEPPQPVETDLPLETLSPRETEVVELLQEGLSNKELAARLGISLHTVKNHVKSVFRKLEVSSRLELVSRLARPTA